MLKLKFIYARLAAYLFIFSRCFWLVCLCLLFVSSVATANKPKQKSFNQIKVAAAYLSTEPTKKLSNLDKKPSNLGLAGAELGIKDNNITGAFLKQEFKIASLKTSNAETIKQQVAQWIKSGYQHILLAVTADLLLAISDKYSDQPVMFYNVYAKDDRLRRQDCRRNIIHIAPSYTMLTDALAQFLITKNWKKWLLVVGNNTEDKDIAAAVRASVYKFGGKIVAEKKWDYGPDSRRTAQKEVPVFTQAVDYDMLIVADEKGEFGEYLIYQTWLPKLVAGTQGLVPTTWHKTHERWGSVQLQSRFFKKYKRKMRPLDYQMWTAIRGIGEAATRTNSNQFKEMLAYMFGDDFAIAAFKGQGLTLRQWNNQIRQPILLASPNSLVSVSPQNKFLHHYSQLDTMGVVETNSNCSIAKK